MDFNDQVFSGNPNQAALAQALRNKEQMGLFAALSGDKALAPAGQILMSQSAAEQAKGIQQEYYRQQMQQAAQRDATDRRGQDLSYQAAMARNATLADIAGQKQAMGGKIPKGTQEEIVTNVGMLRALDSLSKSYNPEWASSFPGSGALRATVAQRAGMLAPQSWKDFQEWRRQFKDWYENPLIHKLYGSALTSTEVQRWRAQAMSDDATPEQVMRFFQATMKAIAPVARGYVDANARMYGAENVAALINDPGLMAPASPSGKEQAMYEIVNE